MAYEVKSYPSRHMTSFQRLRRLLSTGMAWRYDRDEDATLFLFEIFIGAIFSF